MASPPEQALELLTLIYLLHNCHRSKDLDLVCKFEDIKITPRDPNHLPTGLHFDLTIITFPKDRKIRSIIPTVNYYAANNHDNTKRCKSPHIEQKYWKEILIELSHYFGEQLINQILGQKEGKSYPTFPKYEGPEYLLKIPREIFWSKRETKISWGNGEISNNLSDLLVNYEYSFDFSVR